VRNLGFACKSAVSLKADEFMHPHTLLFLDEWKAVARRTAAEMVWLERLGGGLGVGLKG
jgi:hypothetical protein